VKVWLVDTERFLNSSESNSSSICLLKEVTSASSAPVSVLSLTASAESSEKMLLAVGRGSGSLEVWMCDISSSKFQISGSYDAHVQVVTGLTWAFSGRCLYSCSQ
ncbi:Transducin/WD40 repeat-like superfamily protein, partial [Thalictrum thalictroides]